MQSTVRAAALIPNYNNSRTLPDVIERTLAVIADVLVVDDGSTDASWEAIARFGARIQTLRHPVNLGKGRALRDGFGRLSASGFTHAIALDADGQHFPEDIPRFLEAVSSAPATIFVGERDMAGAGAPAASRFGLWCSNTALRILRGIKVRDSQCGFRAYPLDTVSRLDLRGDRYDFELELLFEASRARVPVLGVPVRVTYEPAGGRVSHFRPVRDFLQIAAHVLRHSPSRVEHPKDR
jgi:glycosyltransferase involved in cell wall biosynthesis